ncbi:MAG: sodium/solute symporter [Pseudomonadota bacterium]
MTLSMIDYLVLMAYLAIVAWIGLYMSRGKETAKDYFIAGGNAPQWVVGFTLMATLISSNTLVAHPAIVYDKGMVLVPGFMVMPLVLVFVAYVIVPFYRRVVGLSAYEYIGRRFGLGGRLYTAFGFLMERTFGIGVTLLTTSIAVNVMTGWDLLPIIVAVGLFTMVYTSIGGINAVVWTDVIQGVILIGGGFLILGRLLFAPEAGEPFAVVGAAWEGGRFSLGSAELSYESLTRPDDRTIWMFSAAMAIQWSRRYICDQSMVQRYLIARSEVEARRGALIGALLSVPVLLAFNLVGACLYGFYALSGASPPAIADEVLPFFIIHHLPQGVVGLMLAAILAASMSSISSDLNSLSTVFTQDFIHRARPNLSERLMVLSGRLSALVFGAAAAAVAALLIPQETTTPIAERALVIAVIVSSGTLGLFALGTLTRRATRTGAYVGLAAGALFTIWGVLTEPSARIIDLGWFNFPFNQILIGVFGHVVVFVAGYGVSRLVGGYRPADIETLVLRRAHVSS